MTPTVQPSTLVCALEENPYRCIAGVPLSAGFHLLSTNGRQQLEFKRRSKRGQGIIPWAPSLMMSLGLAVALLFDPCLQFQFLCIRDTSPPSGLMALQHPMLVFFDPVSTFINSLFFKLLFLTRAQTNTEPWQGLEKHTQGGIWGSLYYCFYFGIY